MTFSLAVFAREETRDELVETLRAVVRSIRGSFGLLRCSLLEDVQAPNELRLLTRWKSHDAFERHVMSPIFRRLLLGVELSAEPPELEIQTIAGIRGMDLLHEILQCEEGETK